MVTLFSAVNQRFTVRLMLAALLLGLAACAGTPPPPPPDAGAGPTGGVLGGDDGVETAPIDERGLLGIPPEDRRMFVDPDNPLSTRIIYFAFNSSAIQPRFREAVQAHAAYLAAHPNVDVRLEGHTDERGTREYNVALGERRAESVQRALVVAGASRGQITTLSFGEERPAALGSNPEAYGKNRRVELIYVDK